MARRRALVKRLTAVETLGSTDVICTDKTGTLTEGTMKAQFVWADGEEVEVGGSADPLTGVEPFSAVLRTAVRCNNARVSREGGGWERAGDPSESALLLAADELGEDVGAARIEIDVVRSVCNARRELLDLGVKLLIHAPAIRVAGARSISTPA